MSVEINKILHEKIGVVPDTLGFRNVERAIEQSVLRLSLNNDSELAEVLKNDRKELQNFVELIVVPETWFFRDVEPFVFIKNFAIDFKIKYGNKLKFKVLSVPSSTGEEPFSVAITLLQAGFLPDEFEIDAIDISFNAIKKAKEGLFTKSSFRGNDLNIINAYFKKEGEYFKLDKRIVNSVNFIQANVIEQSFLVNKTYYDIILCRNLLIYLNHEGREKLVKQIDRLLSPTGALIAGHAETLFFCQYDFKPVEHRRSFACIRFDKKNESITAKPFRSTIEAKEPVKTPATKIKLSTKEYQLGMGFDFQPAKTEFKSEVENKTLNGIDIIRDLADKGDFKSAWSMLENFLLEKETDLKALLLAGEIQLALNKSGQAIEYFTKVLYLDPSNLEALMHLSLLYKTNGELLQSDLYLERYKRLLNAQRGEYK